jgi:hypothetical protein
MDTSTHDQLTRAVQARYGCGATHIQAVSVTQIFDGRSVWGGMVHIFRLSGNLISDIAYVWSEAGGKNEGEEIVSFLHIPPIASPRDAIKAAIVWGKCRPEHAPARP